MLGYGYSIGECSLTIQYCRSVHSIRFLEDQPLVKSALKSIFDHA